MTTVYIYPKMLSGKQAKNSTGPNWLGFGHKNLSTQLADKLRQYVAANSHHAINVAVADGSESPEALLRSDDGLVLISPYLRGQFAITSLNIIYLSEAEYLLRQLPRIYRRIDQLDQSLGG
ncbi:hypothetical protein [Lacticaseibacillus saniviri]